MMHIPENYCQNRIVPMKGHNFASILYRYIFYHTTLEFWLRSQCQQITPSTYKYVLLLFSLNSNNGAFRIMSMRSIICQGVHAISVSLFLCLPRVRSVAPSSEYQHDDTIEWIVAFLLREYQHASIVLVYTLVPGTSVV